MKLILGLGITGLSVARFFFKKDISFRIADSRQEPPMLEISKKESVLHDSHFGEWNKSLLDGISEIIISPGIAESESIVAGLGKKVFLLLVILSYLDDMQRHQLLVLRAQMENQP